MRFLTPRCPECGEIAEGTVEHVGVRANITFTDETGAAEYAGESEVWWDEQRPDEDEQGRYTLICYGGHEWQSVVELSTDQSEEVKTA